LSTNKPIDYTWERERENISKNENQFIELAERINSYINENFSQFSYSTDKDELRINYQSYLKEEHCFPSVKIGVSERENLTYSETIDVIKAIAEQFKFKLTTISVNANPGSKIKTENNIYLYENNPSILLDLGMLEDTNIISLKYNKPYFRSENKVVNESAELELFQEDEVLIESVLKTSKYNNKFKVYDSNMSMNGIHTVNLLSTFHPSYITMMERRFESLNKKEFYTVYKNSFEHDMLMRHFIKQIRGLSQSKDVPKETDFLFSLFMYKGQFYPLLVAVSTKHSRIIGVYSFVMKPDKENQGSYYIGKAELFRSPLDLLNEHVLKLRKLFNCFYFG
jgi:hypothetical protein